MRKRLYPYGRILGFIIRKTPGMIMFPRTYDRAPTIRRHYFTFVENRLHDYHMRKTDHLRSSRMKMKFFIMHLRLMQRFWRA